MILVPNFQIFHQIHPPEPHRSPKKEEFSCVTGIYLMSFFYKHPVEVDIHWPRGTLSPLWYFCCSDSVLGFRNELLFPETDD